MLMQEFKLSIELLFWLSSVWCRRLVEVIQPRAREVPGRTALLAPRIGSYVRGPCESCVVFSYYKF